MPAHLLHELEIPRAGVFGGIGPLKDFDRADNLLLPQQRRHEQHVRRWQIFVGVGREDSRLARFNHIANDAVVVLGRLFALIEASRREIHLGRHPGPTLWITKPDRPRLRSQNDDQSSQKFAEKRIRWPARIGD